MDSTSIFLSLFFLLGGICFIGLGILSLRNDMGWIEIFYIPFISERYKKRYMSTEKKREIIKTFDRFIGFSFVTFGVIAIIAAAAICIF